MLSADDGTGEGFGSNTGRGEVLRVFAWPVVFSGKVNWWGIWTTGTGKEAGS